MQSKSITVSSPGKVHLLGEHSVVYGKPAILSAIDLRVYVTISTGESNIDEGIKKVAKAAEDIISNRFKINKLPKYSATINSQIPIGSGLGSSAAVSAAYLEALLTYLNLDHDGYQLNELAFEAEKVFHGTPSGGDNTTVVNGGFIWFQKNQDIKKSFSRLTYKLHPNIKQFFLINSGKPFETTKEMVERVRERLAKVKDDVLDIFEDQGRLVTQLAKVLKTGDESRLVKIIYKGERNLEKLGVVGIKAKKIIRMVEHLGGAAKIMGGGGIKDGSGMLLAYHPSSSKLIEFGKKQSFLIIPITLGEEGIRRES
ncbi:mevalonate kinase [Candidatus Daviesbacteria bacterium]|nr:mevalonate kinase [Candidatus Daviesbacteria bacterium]